jgi:LysM repeat protein
MALASQTVRTQEVVRGPKNNFQSPRRKRRQRNILLAVGAVVLLGGGYLAYSNLGKGEKNASQQGDQANNTNSKDGVQDVQRPAPADRNVPVPVTPKPEQKPDVLTMGSPRNDPKQPVSGDGTSSPSNPATNPGGTNANPPGTDGQGVAPDPLGKPANKQEPAGGSPASNQTPPAATPVTPPAAPPAAAVDDMPADAAAALERAKRAMGENKLVEARGLLNGVLANPRVKDSERDAVRTWLGEVNQTLVFSPTVAANDPLSESYKVASGDVLERIARTRGLAIDWRLLARVNKMTNPNALRVGQSLKLVRGPFHAVVHKSAYRVDIYAGTPLPPGSAGTPRTDGSEDGWTFIKSFPVGLGEKGGTPLGTFVVKKNSKLINPHWVNPRTGEKFDANDPKNPIGEHWLGLAGVDDKTKAIVGYGLHGTIQPESIGKEMSMGCVRMRTDDIALVWELLVDEVSTVRIVE